METTVTRTMKQDYVSRARIDARERVMGIAKYIPQTGRKRTCSMPGLSQVPYRMVMWKALTALQLLKYTVS